MIIEKSPIPGAFLIALDRREDERGSFARMWSAREFEAEGIPGGFVEGNTSLTTKTGTIRGLHYQVPPHEEAKLVRCTRGRIFDVVVDLRPNSPKLHAWQGFEMVADDDRLLYIPPGCAHGLQTLEAETEIFYATTAYHHPSAERGIRWDDPFFSIDWPIRNGAIVSPKDSGWPPFQPDAASTSPSCR